MSQNKYGEDGFYKKPVKNKDRLEKIWNFWAHKALDASGSPKFLVVAKPEGTRLYEVWAWAPTDGNRWYDNYKVLSTHPSLKAAKTTILMLKASQ